MCLVERFVRGWRVLQKLLLAPLVIVLVLTAVFVAPVGALQEPVTFAEDGTGAPSGLYGFDESAGPVAESGSTTDVSTPDEAGALPTVLAFTGPTSQWLIGSGLLFLAIGAAVMAGRRLLVRNNR